MSLVLKLSKTAFLVFATPALAFAQAVPAATAPSVYNGFDYPTIGGTLRYSLTASETVLTGYNGQSDQGVTGYTNLSGNLAYLSRSKDHPFSAVYSGGYLIGNSNFPSYGYQTLSVSQVLNTRNWTFVGADTVEYVPQTPTSGLSGIPGAGDLNTTPVVTGPAAGIGILTLYATRVSNTVSGTATRRLTGSTSLSISGLDFLQRYTGSSASQGINNDQQSGTGTLQHRLDGRTSIGGSYNFTRSTFNYSSLGPGSNSYYMNSAVATYTRQLTHKVTLFVSGGPQWILPGSGGIITHSSVSATANASLNYTGELYGVGLGYSRSVNNGNGVVIGTRYDVLNLSAHRRFGRIFQASGVVGYNKSSQLAGTSFANYNSSGVVASGQLSAQVSPSVSLFGSYSLQRQVFDGSTQTPIALNGLTNYMTFGITYAPKALFNRK